MSRKRTKKQQNLTEEKSIREYVYIDETEVNSVLAQLKDGIPKVIRKINQTSLESSQIEGKSNSYSASGKGGFPPLAEANGGYQHQNSQQNRVGSSDMSQNAIDTVYSDHAIDIIEKELDKMDLMKSHTKQPESKFVKLTQNFTIEDFNLLKEFTTNSGAKKLFNIPGFEEIEQAAIALQGLFPKTVFVKLKSSLVICEEKDFRYNKTQLQTTNFSTRKITVIGRVETIVTKEILGEMENPFSKLSEEIDNPDNSDKDPDEIAVTLLGQIMPELSMYFLRSLFDLKKDDRIIKPIAMYFK